MTALAPLLEKHAEQCIQLAYQCRNKNAERFFRLLAVDLMLAAEQHRLSHNDLMREHAIFTPLSHNASADAALKPESASTA
jgi:hypothetical protein